MLQGSVATEAGGLPFHSADCPRLDVVRAPWLGWALKDTEMVRDRVNALLRASHIRARGHSVAEPHLLLRWEAAGQAEGSGHCRDPRRGTVASMLPLRHTIGA